jgi:adenylosuccinate lyase
VVERRVIARYTPADFAALWAQARRFGVWFDVELAACEAMEEAGFVPRGTAAAIRGKALVLDPARIDEIERTTKHDVIAFLAHIEELAGADARWLDRLLAALARRAREHARTPMIGRSHGIFAEPITFGMAIAGHHAEVARGRARLEAARREIAVGKIAGAVGSYAHLTPEIERHALASLGLQPETVATQVVARDRHAAYFAALALVAAGIERLATSVRHWQRSEVGEAEEAFTPGQKGSSAMPHKRNPILSENLCGLARVVRGAVVPALENVALWHERDISHSSVERMIAPDATSTLAFMLDRAADLVDGLVVYPENMKKNLDRAAELYFSEAVLLALVEAGIARQEAYLLVQRNAMRAWHGEGRFRDLLGQDPEVSEKLNAGRLDELFDLDHALAHVPAILERALGK